MLKISIKRKELKTMGHKTLFNDDYIRNGQKGDPDSLL